MPFDGIPWLLTLDEAKKIIASVVPAHSDAIDDRKYQNSLFNFYTRVDELLCQPVHELIMDNKIPEDTRIQLGGLHAEIAWAMEEAVDWFRSTFRKNHSE